MKSETRDWIAAASLSGLTVIRAAIRRSARVRARCVSHARSGGPHRSRLPVPFRRVSCCCCTIALPCRLAELRSLTDLTTSARRGQKTRLSAAPRHDTWIHASAFALTVLSTSGVPRRTHPREAKPSPRPAGPGAAAFRPALGPDPQFAPSLAYTANRASLRLRGGEPQKVSIGSCTDAEDGCPRGQSPPFPTIGTTETVERIQQWRLRQFRPLPPLTCSPRDLEHDRYVVECFRR